MLALAAALLAQLQPLPPALVPLDSPEGERLLVEAGARRAFFALAGTFQTQRTQAYCGVASAAAVLAALPLEAPEEPSIAPWRSFTQETVFTPAVRAQLPPEFVARGGLTVEQLAFLLAANHADARATLAKGSTLEAFRAEASKALGESGRHVLVDFLRSELGQDTGAHWSPLGAYHAGSDRFLVLDVARFRYPPYWVKAADLFRAMATDDLDSGKSRGWITVEAARGAPPRAEIPPVQHRLVRYAALALGGALLLGAAAGYAVGRGRGRSGEPPLA